MKTFPVRRTGTQSSFTLIEILVAVAVMSLILLILGQMTATVNQAWQAGVGRIDDFTKSRAILDLAVSDLQHAVIRSDFPLFQINGVPNQLGANGFTNTGTAANPYTGFLGFTNPPGANCFSPSFYTRVPGVPSTTGTSVRDVSYVKYAIVPTGDSDVVTLQRTSLAVPWVNGASYFTNNLANVTTTDTQNMAPGVCGFEFTFRTANGSVSTNYTGYVQANPVVAVGVTIAVIGKPTLTKLSVAQVTAIQNKLSADVANANTLTSVKYLWDKQTIPNEILTTAGYPHDLEVNLKTFERWVAPPQPF